MNATLDYDTSFEDHFEGELRINSSGVDLTYQVIQLRDFRCGEGFLEFVDNSTCIGVKECGGGYYLSEDEFERNQCRKCSR